MTVVSTADLKNKGDNIHFDSYGQRKFGARYAAAFLKLMAGKVAQQ